MTLRETFATYNLTSGQSSLIDELEKFLADNSTCFLLKGYAGTGKTFMMKGLTDFLFVNKRSFRISAPTGRAAKVISQKTKHKAYTIHKSIYSSKDLKEFKVKDEDGTETFKFYYDLKNNEDPANTVYIIDESSMLSNVYSEGEFFRFGSGYLLKDLIRYINFDNNGHNKKIIFIGDNAQLPPVNMNFSPALDGKYLRENCTIESKEFELTEVVRQKADSGILHNATVIRESIKANVFNKIDIETNFKDINKTTHEEFLSKYVLTCNNAIDENTTIIAYSNSSVKTYNDLIRNHFFPHSSLITKADRIILVSNNYNYEIELLNGDYGVVIEVLSEQEKRETKLRRNNRNGETIEVLITIIYRNVKIEFKDIENIPYIIECKIIENLLYSKERDISSDQQKAIYIDFWIRNPKLNQIKQLLHSKATNFENLQDVVKDLSPNDLNPLITEKIKHLQAEYFKNQNNTNLRQVSINILKDALRADPYFNALRIKFGYAVTCHKAQGGEWKNTFLNCKTSMGYFNSSYFRWLYTGITRAKENLFTLDEPHFKIGSNLQSPRIEIIASRQDIFVLSEGILEMEIPFDLPNETPFLRNIFLAVNDILKDSNLNINSIKHTSYLEHYTFSQGNENAVFKIHYNNQNKITRIEKPVNTTILVETIHSALIHLENKAIILSEEGETETVSDKVFEFEKPFLKEFYESIILKITVNSIVIKDIEHKQYNEIYVFQKNGFTATYKFHYNGSGRFGKFEIVQNRTTGLTNEINELLK